RGGNAGAIRRKGGHFASVHHDAGCSCACDGFEALEPIGFHERRHSYSSFLDAAGISEVRADRYMGHSNYSMRARYTHALEAQLAEDANRLDEYLTGAASGRGSSRSLVQKLVRNRR